ncbi:MAG: choice-of-anchor Q domain-containing protein [Bacteroidota bacterium]
MLYKRFIPICHYIQLLLSLTFIIGIGNSNAQEIIYVNDDANGANTGLSWDDAFTNLQDALAEAENGDEIWVASGIYKPTKCNPCNQQEREVSFLLVNSVKLIGGFNGVEISIDQRKKDSVSLFGTNLTILSGDIGLVNDTSDNSYSILSSNNLETVASISGFKISGGNANESFIFPHGSKDSGGGIFIQSGSLKIEDCIISENFASYEGGSIFSSGRKLEILNCIFKNNHAHTGGGIAVDGVGISENRILINSSKFCNNSSTVGGGCHFYETDLNIQNSTFLENQSSDGGGLRISNSQGAISNTHFLNNYAKIGGGGVSTSSSKNFYLKNVIFLGNTVEQSGGGLRIFGKIDSVVNCRFEKNISLESGGAISCTSGETEIIQSSFVSNSARVGGGIDLSFSSVIKLCNSNISSNHADDYFSGISVYNSKLILDKSIFSGNRAGTSGGALGAFRSFLDLKLCSFQENRSEERGGAIWAYECDSISVQNCSFQKNESFFGGAFYATASNSRLDDLIFEENISRQGGGLYYVNGEIKMTKSIFSNNSSDFGGGILESNNSLHIEKTKFIGNKSKLNGGAVYSSDSQSAFYDCLIENNSSDEAAGGISLRNSNFFQNKGTYNKNLAKFGGAIYAGESIAKFVNVSFSENKSENSGGAAYVEENNIEWDSCRFFLNQSNFGAGIFNFNSISLVKNSILEDNLAFVSGGAIYSGRGVLNVELSQIRNNQADDSGGGITNTDNNKLTIFYTRISGNSSTSFNGGGILNTFNSSSDIRFSLIDQNSSRFSGGGIYNMEGTVDISSSTLFRNFSDFNGGNISSSLGKTTLFNSTVLFDTLTSKRSDICIRDSMIIKGSIINNFSRRSLPNLVLNFEGTLLSHGYNLISDTTGSRILFADSDILGSTSSSVNPLLSVLADNGGPIPTLSLFPGSPAIGRGEPISSTEILTDQRGYSRVLGSKNDSIDIGAFEYQESHIDRDITQFCKDDSAFIPLADIVLTDSTGGAWPIDSNQILVLNLPENVEVQDDEMEIEFSGEGIEKVDAFISNNQLHITYNRSYTTTSNSIRIKGLKLKTTLAPGFYDILRSEEGTAVQNGNNLSDRVSHGRIWVLPSVKGLPYDDSFEEEAIWQAELSSNLWQWGEPNDTRINSASEGQKVFMTNLSGNYEANTRTWLYSPCVNLSGTQNPTLSFDYWADMESQIDGVVMQYSLDRGNSWKTLGSDSTGRSWYNSSSIVSNPANQDSTQRLGWTGVTDEWRKAIHRLPNGLRQVSSRFRLVFKSGDFVNPIDGFNGFAMDNLSISDYQKNVLAEFFVQNADDLESTFTQLEEQFNDELLTISYPLSEATTEIDSRSNFYGKRETNTLILDGQSFYDPPSLVSYPDIDSLSLEVVPFELDFFTSDSTNFHITSIQPINEEVVVQVGIVEKEALLQGETVKNVVRKFIPDAAGISISNWSINETRTFSFMWENSMIPPPSNRYLNYPDKFYHIVFIQGLGSKRIYQAEILPIPLIVSNQALFKQENFKLFPNPASEEVFVSTLSSLALNLEVNILDLQGKLLLKKRLTNKYAINLEDLPEGIYLLKISTDRGSSVVKKLIVNR